MTAAKIFEKIKHLNEQGFDVHTIKCAWYSSRSILNALGGDGSNSPEVEVVRVGTPGGGMIEIHDKDNTEGVFPRDYEGRINLMCYCCFGGKPDQGSTTLENLPAKLLELKDHNCPPWPG